MIDFIKSIKSSYYFHSGFIKIIHSMLLVLWLYANKTTNLYILVFSFYSPVIIFIILYELQELFNHHKNFSLKEDKIGSKS